MAVVFISYARADGRLLADQLAEELQQHDHRPWLDRAEIMGGEEWSRSIETAIDNCDVLLALLTHGSYESAICRAEQSRALRRDKLVVPILAQADADRPIYLESRHYIDFSNPPSFAAALGRLLDAIGRGLGVRFGDLPQQSRDRLLADGPIWSMAAPLHDRTADWAQIAALADAQRDRFLKMLAPRRAGIATFEPSLYVPRAGAEQELDAFSRGDAPGLLLLGDSGSGKTNLLCRWALREAADGHAVFMYHCDRLRSSKVEQELTRDLGLDDPAALPDALERIEELARIQSRRLILVLDGINRFRGPGSERPRDLLVEIDEVLARRGGANLRVVTSCTTAAWSRLDRLGALKLSWGQYHRTGAGEEFVLLADFEEGEAETAYDTYRRHFALAAEYRELPPTLQLHLRHPLLLRFFAETARGAPLTGDDPVLDALIGRYLSERLRLREDRRFVDQLAGEMLARERAALPVRSLAEHPVLGEAVRDEGPDSAYNRMLDTGVLIQVDGDGLFVDDIVRFAYPLIGAHALAGKLLTEAEPVEQTMVELVGVSEELPFAWEAAAIMLANRGGDELHATLAAATRPELRELATESLARIHARDSARGRRLLMALLDGASIDGKRTALRTAYNIGPDTRDLFLHAAMSGSEELRQAVRDILYLIWTGQAGGVREPAASAGYFLWRQAPGFTYGVMRDMVARVSWLRPRSANRILRFVLDLVITIYVNHCERNDVAQQTADLYYELTVNRLHLDRITLGSRVERLVLRVVAGVLSTRILQWMLMDEGTAADTFFALPSQDRAILSRLGELLDPGTDFRQAEDPLRRALSSDVAAFRGAAALVTAIHAHADFAANEEALRRLCDDLDGRGRLWLLIAFSVLLPTTPPEWVPFLETLTRRLVDEHREIALDRNGLYGNFDIAFLPLGLAYGKCDRGMPLFDEWLCHGLAQADATLVASLVSALGPAGFYHPRAVLLLLQKHWQALQARPTLEQELVTALGIVRTLHVDRVDAFLAQVGADPATQRRVATTADVELVQRFVHSLGYFNNSVHYCLHYPRMRRDLGVFALELLARAASPQEFIVRYAEQAIRMARDAGFHLLEWTLPIES